MSTVGELVDAARRDVERGRVPACQVAVARDGELVVFETLGAATDDTRFCIFSATKPIVASAVWMLMADGGLDVARPVAEFIPEFGTNGKEAVTVEHVMLHTAGFPTAPIGETETRERRLQRFGEWRLEWEPGSRFTYHPSQAHWVLAELIQRRSGMDFRDMIEQRVTGPLGLPRVLGVGPDDGPVAELIPVGSRPPDPMGLRFNDPDVRAAGVPGGGAFMTAAQLALFYQGLLHDPHRMWEPAVLGDATATIRCTLTDPLMGVPANRSLGLVIAGDDGQHVLRYAGFGPGCSAGSFGHAGAFMQVGWADPATGLSFAYVSNALESDQMKAGARGVRLAGLAADLTSSGDLTTSGR